MDTVLLMDEVSPHLTGGTAEFPLQRKDREIKRKGREEKNLGLKNH